MSAIETLKELQKRVEENNATGEKKERKKFIVLKDGDAKRIRFLQELVKDAENYDPKRGTASVVKVHKSPKDFKKTAACVKRSEEHGFNCWACTQVENDPKWKPRDHLLVNIGVYDAENESWEHMIVDQTFNQRHIGSDVVDFAAEYGTVTDRTYKFSRKGSGLNNTGYGILPIKEEKEPKDFADWEMVDTSALYRRLQFDDQKKHLLGEEENPADSW